MLTLAVAGPTATPWIGRPDPPRPAAEPPAPEDNYPSWPGRPGPGALHPDHPSWPGRPIPDWAATEAALRADDYPSWTEGKVPPWQDPEPEQMVASQYEAIVTPATQQLNTEMAAYAVDERRDLAAAEADLSAEVATEQAFDKSLAAATFTPQNRATADALIQSATSSATPVPLAAAIFTPQVTAIADALIQANLARAELTAEQARSSSLTQLRSFNQRVQVASVAVQTEMTLIGKALDSPSP